jgi:hypothetical protein
MLPLAIQDIDESDEHIEENTTAPADSPCEVEERSPVDPVPDRPENECASSDIRTLTVKASKKHEQPLLGTKSESAQGAWKTEGDGHIKYDERQAQVRKLEEHRI